MILPNVGVISSAHVIAAVGGTGAVRFSASGQKYTRSATGINATTDLTWCCWVKLASDLNAIGAILDTDNGSGNYHWLGASGTGTGFGRDATTGAASTGFDFTIGTWCFIAEVCTVTGNDQIYWVNAPGTTLNLLDTGAVGGGLADANTFSLGTSGFASTRIDGSIAAVKVWLAALTKTELETELPKYAAQRTANLWAAYSFSAGPQTTDDSGNGRTLTVAGTPTLDSAGPPCT